MDSVITKNQVIHTIGTKLSEEFSAEGFKYIKSKKDLIRKTKNGFDKIVFSTYDSYPISHQVLSLGFLKRLNAVEDIVNQFFDERFRSPDFSKSSTTVVSNQVLLNNKMSYNFKPEMINNCLICKGIINPNEDGFILHTEKDIKNISNYLITFIQDQVLPFFEANNDLSYINKNQKKQMVETFNSKSLVHPLLLMRSLVLMKLTKDSDFEILKNKYLKKAVNPYDDFGVNKLEVKAVNELIDYLEVTEF